MILTKRIKIWTLLTHAFIIIGMGHGIGTLGILEALSLSTIFSEPRPAYGGDVSSLSLWIFGLLALIGQIAIIVSIFIKVKTIDHSLHLFGLFLLWASLLTCAYGIRNDHYTHLAVVTCFPFLYFTIRTLVGSRIQKLWRQAVDKI